MEHLPPTESALNNLSLQKRHIQNSSEQQNQDFYCTKNVSVKLLSDMHLRIRSRCENTTEDPPKDSPRASNCVDDISENATDTKWKKITKRITNVSGWKKGAIQDLHWGIDALHAASACCTPTHQSTVEIVVNTSAWRISYCIESGVDLLSLLLFHLTLSLYCNSH